MSKIKYEIIRDFSALSALVLGSVDGMEREIDRLVYRLYGLTEEEIKIVENKT